MARSPSASSLSEARGIWTWSAVLAGVIASLITQVLLTLLGLGIGLISVDAPTASAAPAAIGSAAMLWWIASGVFSAFVGGAIAGAYAPLVNINARIAHALAAWAVAALIVIGFASLSAGGAANVASNIAGPSATASARLQTLNRPAIPGTPALTPAQMENARKAFAASMFASFIGLLLGGIAAFLGGWWSEEIRGEVGAKARR